MYAPGDSGDKMAAAIKDFNEYVIKDERVEVIALPFRDGVNIVQRRYCSALLMCYKREDIASLQSCTCLVATGSDFFFPNLCGPGRYNKHIEGCWPPV